MSSKPKAKKVKAEKSDKQTGVNGEVTSPKKKKLILPPLNNNQKKIRTNPFEELKKKTEEMQEKLCGLESSLTQAKTLTLNNLSELNSNIEDRNQRIKELSKDNAIFFQNLKMIKEEVDDKMKFVKIFKLKEEELNKKETDLKKIIEMKDKELKITLRNIEIYKKDKQRYEKMLNEFGKEDTLPQLLNTINELNIKSEELINTINSLKKIKNEHKNCEQKRNKKSNQLSLLKNEYEFQLKRENLSQTMALTKQQRQFTNKDDSIHNNSSSPKLFSKKSPNKGVKTNRFKASLAPIWKELDEANIYKSVAVTLSSRMKIRNNSEEHLATVDNSLFKPYEKEVLSKLIPNEHLDSFNERFMKVENEKQEIVEKIKYNTQIKKKEIKGNKDKVDYSSLQMKEQTKKTIKLNSEITKQKREIADLNNKIKQLKSDLKFTNDLMAIKTKENDKLTAHFDEINEKIEKGILVLKEKEENNEDEEEIEENEEESDNVDEED